MGNERAYSVAGEIASHIPRVPEIVGTVAAGGDIRRTAIRWRWFTGQSPDIGGPARPAGRAGQAEGMQPWRRRPGRDGGLASASQRLLAGGTPHHLSRLPDACVRRAKQASKRRMEKPSLAVRNDFDSQWLDTVVLTAQHRTPMSMELEQALRKKSR